MSELRFKVGDEVEVGVVAGDHGYERATWPGETPDAWRRAEILETLTGRAYCHETLTGRAYCHRAAWVNPSGKPFGDFFCEKHMRPLAKIGQPRVAEAVATPSTEPECKCADYWNHDPGCAYAAWSQARRKRLG